jgi:hypothetical protein
VRQYQTMLFYCLPAVRTIEQSDDTITVDCISILAVVFFSPLFNATALTWLYCLFWFLVQDAGKVLLYKFMYKYNICHINRQTSHVEHYHEAHFQARSALLHIPFWIFIIAH